MENLLEKLKSLLQKDERLISEGELLKNKIIELALKLDKDLIKLLLSNKNMKEVFFADVDATVVFDKDKFIRFVSNKQFLPDSYTAFKNKIGLTLVDDYLSEKKEVVLSWPYKDCVLEGGMTKEDQKRNEIFWNETLAPDEISRLFDPKVFTNVKRIDKKGEHKFDGFRIYENGDIKDNLIIKGNNLLALHSIKKRFAGKIKLIFIDPPYNREADTFYNDSFRHSSWLTFMKNRLDVGRDLLSDDGVIFIICDDVEQAYLKVLMDDIFTRECFVDTIAVQMSIVQGEKVRAAKDGNIVKNTEFIHVYSKRPLKNIGNNPLYDITSYDPHYSLFLIGNDNDGYIEVPLGKKIIEEEDIKEDLSVLGLLKKKNKQLYLPNSNLSSAYIKSDKFKQFIFSNRNNIARIHDLRLKESEIKEKIPKNKIIKISRGNRYYLVGYDSNGTIQQRITLEDKIRISDDFNYEFGFIRLRGDWWQNFYLDMGNVQKEGGVKLSKGKKPERLLENIIKFTTKKGDIVLDFHLGSGTTCAVAHKMNRQYVGIEQLDYGENDSLVRLKNVINGDTTGVSKYVGWKGGGDFVYLELMEWNENFVEKIKKAKTKEELKILWEAMKKKAFLSYKVDTKAVDENAKGFKDLSIEDQKRFLLELLDKNHLYVNYSEIDDEEYGVSEGDKKLNKRFYS